MDAYAVREQSDELVRVAKKIKVLSVISWPPSVTDQFLERYRAGDVRLPEPPPVKKVRSVDKPLKALQERADPKSPTGAFLQRTAESYRKIAGMIQVAGTPAAYALSREIYGGAKEPLHGTSMNQLDAANKLLAATKALAAATPDDENEYCLTPEAVAAALRKRWKRFFEKPIRIVVDPKLGAKAAASAHRVRLRDATCFSETDIAQLSEHEIGVHSLTSRNGRAQPVLTALSLGSPRTTATQEGLATFAELITGSIDLARLRRLAYRVHAIHLAEEGADFIEVFRWLVSIEEPEGEAARTAARIFRGGDVRGRFPFTKDVVYLRGLFAVHTFLRKVITERRPELISRLFVGRLTLTDIFELEPLFEKNLVGAPKYVPPWAANVRNLAAFLAFSGVVNAISLRDIALESIHT